jgi:ATP-dependent Clp protease protease subunit
MSSAPSTQILPAEVYGVFSDQINQASVQRIFQNLALATNAGVKHAHILFHSTGGLVPDGIALYNLFRALPIELTLYNPGSVQSIAVIAYLGAKHRKASANATFQIHRTIFTSQAARADQLEVLAEVTHLDDVRTEGILRAHLKLSDKDWDKFDRAGLMVFSAQDAVKIQMADELADFSPPQGAKIFNI